MFDTRGFVHLNVRSNFSLKDGAFFPEQLAMAAAELGMPAVALTDRDGLYGASRFVDACSKVGVRPILGATLTIRAHGPPDGVHARAPGPADTSIVVLARDAVGYANLCRLVTDAHMTGERGDPALAPAQVLAHAEGLVCLLGPESGPGRLALGGLHDAAVDAARPFREAFGDDLVVEVRHRLERDSEGEVRRLLRLADDLGAWGVATNAVRYLVPEDAFLADALECMREIVPIAQNHVTRTNAEGWLKPAGTMRRLFAGRPEVCDATLRVAERCTFDLALRSVHFPEFPTPAGRSGSSVLAERCHRGLGRRGIRKTREVRERLDLELSMIHRLGYSSFFLTVADIVADVRSIGIRTACRGSAAGSFVCYLTGISDVDPIRHGLVFERFLNPLRDELPDIDIDVESARREDVYDLVLSRHGDDRCACVCMVDTYRARGAIREVGKALGLPEVEVDTVAKAFPHIGAHHIREAVESLPELVGSNIGAGQLEQLFRVAERLNGFPRHLALHPSGVVLAGHDLVERVPLERSFQGYRMIQADKDDVELLGYLKLDVLGIRMLSTMRHAVDEIARTAGEKVDLDRVPFDDEPTFELIRRSDTLGCFQIESPGQRELLQKLQPTRWEDLIVDISLFRPGPVKSDMVSPFLKRRHGMELPVYAHDSLRPVLSETHGVVVYHEQVMRTFAAIAGYDLAEADRIRRHLSDDLEVDSIREDFLRRVRERGLPPADAERIWKELLSFASFGFCKAHAAAFAVPTFQSSWLKAHWPAHFLAGVLTHEPGMYPRRLMIEDARQHGIPVLPLDVNVSEADYTVEVIASGWPEPAGELHGAGACSQAGPHPLPQLDPAPVRASGDRRPYKLLHGTLPPATAPAQPNWWTQSRGRARTPDHPIMSAGVDEGTAGEGARVGGGAAAGALSRSRSGAERRAGGGDGAKRPPQSTAPEVARPNESETTHRTTVTYAIRLALKDVHGISDDEIRSILEARADRPFADVGDFVRRTRVSRPVVERLAHAGGFDALPGGATAPGTGGSAAGTSAPGEGAGAPGGSGGAGRGSRDGRVRSAAFRDSSPARGRTRRDRLYAAMTAEPQREGHQLTLGLDQEVVPGLREYSDAERVRAELEVVQMDVSRHLISFYEPLLEELGVTRSRDLWRRRGGDRVVVAGVKVASQTPAVRSGQRIIFLTLDDATGPVDVTVFESAQARCAKAVFHAFLLAVRGTLRRTGVRGVSVIAEDALDLAALHRRRRQLPPTDRTGVRPPVKLWHSSGGSAGW
ncbi:MAG: DNA polymerase III subunit alpha [Actinomycetota bacterium]